MSPVTRQESPSDVAAIHTVTVAAFLNAPHTDHTEQFIVDALRRAGALTISLVAEEAGEVAGHVAVSPVSVSDGSAGWYGLGPISVRPELQGRGIGSLLMQAALRLLRERGATGCVLLGDPAYYSRFGFKLEAGLCYLMCLRGISRHYHLANRCPMVWLRTMRHSVHGANTSLQAREP